MVEKNFLKNFRIYKRLLVISVRNYIVIEGIVTVCYYTL